MKSRRSHPASTEPTLWRLGAHGSGILPVVVAFTLTARISPSVAAENPSAAPAASPQTQFSSLTQTSAAKPAAAATPPAPSITSPVTSPSPVSSAAATSTTPLSPTPAIIPFTESATGTDATAGSPATTDTAVTTADTPLPSSTLTEPKPARTATLNTNTLPEAPSGFSDGSSFPLGGTGESILEGFTLAANLAGQYNTNVTQSPGEPIAPIEEDFILSAGANLSYLSSATDWTFGGNYRGSYDSYFNNDQFSGYNQGAGLLANYDGTRLSVNATASAAIDRGANRYYDSANFIERTSLNTRISARYKLSPKSVITGNIGGGLTTSDGGSYSDTSSFDLGASGLWKYSPLTEFGPGLRYTFRSGSSQLDRTSLGPTLTVNYKLSKKVGLNSRVGVDFAQYEDGTTADPTLSASIGLNYQASKLWGMNLSFYRDTQADPSIAGAYQEIGSLRLGYYRKIQRARLSLGLNLESSSTEYPDDSTRAGIDRDYFSIDGSIGMPILSNTTFASIYTRYNQRNGSVTDTWDSVQAGFSISRSF